MAEKSICLVDGCGKPQKSLGWCCAHYTRMRRHGTLELKRNPDGTSMAFVQAALASNADECIPWPYAKSSGYGTLRHDGKNISAHRYICESVHGTAKPPANYACHSCGNRACVNPRHIRWGTNIENYWDMVRHGNRKTTHLNEANIVEIRASTASAKELAQQYNVTLSAIHQILSRRNWKHVA